MKFGPLPGGTYTYAVYESFNGATGLVGQATFTVAPVVNAPALECSHLLLLAGGLSLVGALIILWCAKT